MYRDTCEINRAWGHGERYAHSAPEWEYQCFSEGGQSGGPVFLAGEDPNCIFGVHYANSDSGYGSSAIPLTSKLVHDIREIICQYESEYTAYQLC